MKYRKTALRFGAALAVAAVATSANAAGAFDTIAASVDFDSVATWVGTIGIAIVGIAMAFKAIDLAKRGVRKA
ncbi:hypothetical protein [Chitinilyticum litopenaei]|uniref:hypothetical protein n=1 Tax=Chitinilyticum litopenaei TaxID=1121276 RepID=UPI0003F5274F|nr:hypothetical protein [Chitinilyticum litopenaei]